MYDTFLKNDPSAISDEGYSKEIKEFWDAVKIFKSVLKCIAFNRFKSFSLYIDGNVS